jgi:hypothetical protein
MGEPGAIVLGGENNGSWVVAVAPMCSNRLTLKLWLWRFDRSASGSSLSHGSPIRRDDRTRDRRSGASFSVFELLPSPPILTIASVMELLDITRPTAAKTSGGGRRGWILVETSGRKRDRIHGNARYRYRGLLGF